MNTGKNAEGYADPTASAAIGQVSKEEKEVGQLIHLMKDLARICGYEVVGRIAIKDTKTERVWK